MLVKVKDGLWINSDHVVSVGQFERADDGYELRFSDKTTLSVDGAAVQVLIQAMNWRKSHEA